LKAILKSVFLVGIPQLAAVILWPKVRDVIGAAQFAAEQMVNLAMPVSLPDRRASLHWSRRFAHHVARFFFTTEANCHKTRPRASIAFDIDQL
jgi:hypothetical protein